MKKTTRLFPRWIPKREGGPEISLVQFMTFTITPLLIGVVITTLWNFVVYVFGIIDPRNAKDVEMMASGTIPGQWIVWGLLAASALNKVLREFEEVVRAKNTNNKAAFLASRHSRIHPIMYIIMDLFSIIIVLCYWLHPFASSVNGAFTVFTASFGFAFMHYVIVDLDNPVEGIFNVDVSGDWREEYQNKLQTNHQASPH